MDITSSLILLPIHVHHHLHKRFELRLKKSSSYFETSYTSSEERENLVLLWMCMMLSLQIHYPVLLSLKSI